MKVKIKYDRKCKRKIKVKMRDEIKQRMAT